MPNPYLHSGKRDSDVMTTDWPIATKDLLRDFQRLEASHRQDELRRDIFSLIAARKALGDARIAVSAAKRFQKDAAVIRRLDELLVSLAAELEDFPLTVV